jgi:hypothetical protein
MSNLLFWWDSGLISGLHRCKTDALSLEPLYSLYSHVLFTLLWSWSPANICLDWLWILILLIPASQGAKLLLHKTQFLVLDFRKFSWTPMTTDISPIQILGKQRSLESQIRSQKLLVHEQVEIFKLLIFKIRLYIYIINYLYMMKNNWNMSVD